MVALIPVLLLISRTLSSSGAAIRAASSLPARSAGRRRRTRRARAPAPARRGAARPAAAEAAAVWAGPRPAAAAAAGAAAARAAMWAGRPTRTRIPAAAAAGARAERQTGAGAKAPAPRAYLKPPNAPGQRAFSRCAASFFLEIRQYFCEKMSCSARKFLAAGHIAGFQIHPGRYFTNLSIA